MTIIYVVTRLLTFFGAILRAFWEQLVCRVCKIAAEDIRPFKYSELCGHIEHELIKNPGHAFLMCFVPFTLNFILSCCFLFSASYRLFYIGGALSFQSFIFLWLGVSCAANCAPSFEDMLDLKDCIYNGKSIALKILATPFFGVYCASACLEKYSLTFILSVLWAVIFPHIFAPVVTLFYQLSHLL